LALHLLKDNEDFNVSMKPLSIIPLLLFLFTGAALPVLAQTAVPPPMPAYQPLPAAQLDQLLGPIALYPDPLIAQMLPASTVPTQIVLADRYVSGGGDPNQIEQQPWDASVKAMARYTNVLKWMDDNLAWTTELGQAPHQRPHDCRICPRRLAGRMGRHGRDDIHRQPTRQGLSKEPGTADRENRQGHDHL
jgi:hypothetical protein